MTRMDLETAKAITREVINDGCCNTIGWPEDPCKTAWELCKHLDPNAYDPLTLIFQVLEEDDQKRQEALVAAATARTKERRKELWDVVRSLGIMLIVLAVAMALEPTAIVALACVFYAWAIWTCCRRFWKRRSERS